ncbi:DUF29 domain-containing protein [Jiella avicenniae]|uniref:DUF29 domain-containing protein n=1 Tax=Jiella avicenniae TaxID=2907202 RepID=A0A9X1T378_9HYPH|nr:DUF29 domain-containing protein [Jiella avicenniae]MCE7026787.1 DUF29 domain-containing protein [Jiella avicenniae]
MSNAPKVDAADDLYDRDGYAWSKREADLLRQGRFAEIDIANVVEEIESVGRSELRAIVSSYRLIAMHLLKWQHQPERRTRSWRNTINRERGTLEIDEAKNLSLAARPLPLIDQAYRTARKDAADETGLPLSTFPETCPYTAEELRSRDFLPE